MSDVGLQSELAQATCCDQLGIGPSGCFCRSAIRHVIEQNDDDDAGAVPDDEPAADAGSTLQMQRQRWRLHRLRWHRCQRLGSGRSARICRCRCHRHHNHRGDLHDGNLSRCPGSLVRRRFAVLNVPLGAFSNLAVTRPCSMWHVIDYVRDMVAVSAMTLTLPPVYRQSVQQMGWMTGLSAPSPFNRVFGAWAAGLRSATMSSEYPLQWAAAAVGVDPADLVLFVIFTNVFVITSVVVVVPAFRSTGRPHLNAIRN